MRTSYAQGHPYEGDRDGYHIVRKHGRFMVFPTTVVSELARQPRSPRRAGGDLERRAVPLATVGHRPRIAWVHHVHRDMWEMVLDPGLAKAGKFFEHRLAPAAVPPHPDRHAVGVVAATSSSSTSGSQPSQISVVPPGHRRALHPGRAKSDVPLVVAVGRLMPSKRFDELVRIAAEVRRDVPDLAARHRRRRLRATQPRCPGGRSRRRGLGPHRRQGLRRGAAVALPAGLGGGERLHRRGLGHDPHRGRRVRHPVGRHRHRRPPRLRRRRAVRAARRRRSGPGPRPHRRAHRRRAEGEALRGRAAARRHPHLAATAMGAFAPLALDASAGGDGAADEHPPSGRARARHRHLLGPHVGRQRLARPARRRRAHRRPARPDGPRHRAPDPPTRRPTTASRTTSSSGFPAEPVDAIGFSLGARTLLTIASAHPERFHSLVVAGVGANLFRPPGEIGSIGGVFDGSVEPEDPTMRYFSALADAPDQDRDALAALVRRPNPSRSPTRAWPASPARCSSSSATTTSPDRPTR